MKTRLSFLFLLSFVFYLGVAQVPQGFNYQAIARDGSGLVLPNTSLDVMFYIRSLSTGGTLYWQELHTGVTTNNLGLFSLTVGTGARQGASTVATFDLIDWTVSPKWLETDIKYLGSWKDMGVAPLYAVPYAMAAKSLIGAGKLGITGTTTDLEEAIFEVKNKSGQTILGVYNEGVRIYVDNGSKGSKGGFAVGGFDQTKATWNQEFLRVTGDSTRIYVNQAASKGAKGGFAVGGFDASKADPITTFTSLTPQNYFIGHESGLKTKPTLTSGIYNSFFGYQTGKANISGMSNVFIGYLAGTANTASYNVFIGSEAGPVNNSGYNNIFVGYRSGFANLGADNNVFIGSETGYKTQSGSKNVFMGFKAGHENVSGANNTFLGYQAGYYNTGSNNSFFGISAGENNTDGTYNLYMGPYAGRGVSTGASGDYNIFIGNYSGQGVTTGQYNSFVGFMSGRNFTSGLNNSFFGYEAGFNSATGNNNTFIGYRAGRSATSATAYDNVMIGQDVGYLLSTGHDNIALGNQAGYNNTSGNYNIYIGSDAGKSNQTSNYNTMIGYLAGTNSTVGFNTMIGYNAGYANTAYYNQVFIGYRAGFASNGGGNNTYIGSESGYNNTSGAENVFLGIGTGRSNLGSNNVFLGAWAGDDLAGSNKLVIESAYGQGNSSTTPLIYGEFDNNTLRTNSNMGINYSGVSGYGLIVDTPGSQTESFALYVLGSAYAAGGTWQSSDKSLKSNIKTYENAIETVKKLRGVTFEWNPELVGDNGLQKGTQVGVIAQEIEAILPNLVREDMDGNKAVNYDELTPILIEAIKEQQKQIDLLKAEIEQLKKK